MTQTAPAASSADRQSSAPDQPDAGRDGTNLDQLLSKAVEMKGRIAQVQDDLCNVSADGTAANGKVTVTCDGDGRMTDIRIDPEVASGDPDILRELIMTAVESARKDARAQSNDKLRDAVAELPLPATITGFIGQLLTLR